MLPLFKPPATLGKTEPFQRGQVDRHVSKTVTIMKPRFTLLLSALMALVSLTASAQLDTFAVPRWLVLDAGTTTITTTAAVTVTNNPVDIHGFDGVATVVLTGVTNSSTSTGVSNLISQWIETSSDLVSWSTPSNCAVATLYTNIVANGSLSATNVYEMPGTVTTATAASDGFAGTYLAPTAFTSAGIALTNSTSGGVTVIGFPIADGKRYIRSCSRVPSGTNNSSFSAFIIARKSVQ